MTEVLWWALTVVLGLVAVLWVLLWLAVYKAVHDTRFLLAPTAGDPAPTKVSVIIPARNEEGAIGNAVRAVLAQDHTDLELIVVDDASEDATRAEALEAGKGDPRLRVIAGRPLPEGWLGKPSAVFHGRNHATGDVLLFVDADVKIAPTAVRTCVRALEERGLDMLSLWGRWIMVGFWERVAQPVVGSFIRGAHPLDKCNDPADPTVFANGQFIMIRAQAYEAFGGHETVRNEVLEDVRFAQRASEAGLVCGMFLAPDLFEMRPYESLADLWSGYVKNFYHGTGRSPGKALAAAFFVTTTTLVPAVTAAWGAATADPVIGGLSGLILLLQLAFRFVHDGAIGLPRVYGLTHILGNAVLVGIILHSTVRGLTGRKTSWKGRPVQG
jgi:chlorobactene glucosyltransferase